MLSTPHLQPDFDHTAFAVHDALACAANFRVQFGATPILGEALEDFRYLTIYVGSADHGTKVEFLEPTADGFLTQYLTKRGQSPHHITFLVPDVRDAVAAAREHGFGVVDENYEHSAWQEAFIRPDATHRTIIQLASSDRHYPSPEHLLTSQERDALAMPHIHRATDRDWWSAIWEIPPGTMAHIGPTVLHTTDMRKSRILFERILQGQPRDSHVQGGVLYTWPSGAVEVIPSDTPGIAGIRMDEASDHYVVIE